MCGGVAAVLGAPGSGLRLQALELLKRARNSKGSLSCTHPEGWDGEVGRLSLTPTEMSLIHCTTVGRPCVLDNIAGSFIIWASIHSSFGFAPGSGVLQAVAKDPR